MDVVALAQHGVDYAVATLGTATTPVHVQKLLRQTDEWSSASTAMPPGARPRGGRSRMTPARLADGKHVRFPVPAAGRGPGHLRAQARQGGFREALVDSAVPLSAFLLDELAARHPPDARGRPRRARRMPRSRYLAADRSAGAVASRSCASVAELSRPRRIRVAELAVRAPLGRRDRAGARPAPPRSRAAYAAVAQARCALFLDAAGARSRRDSRAASLARRGRRSSSPSQRVVDDVRGERPHARPGP